MLHWLNEHAWWLAILSGVLCLVFALVGSALRIADRVLVLADNITGLVKNVNEVVSPQNRAHFNAVLANADSLHAGATMALRRCGYFANIAM